jgi:hypothetical protein
MAMLNNQMVVRQLFNTGSNGKKTSTLWSPAIWGNRMIMEWNQHIRGDQICLTQRSQWCQMSSKSISEGLMGTVVSKIFDTDHGIVPTPQQWQFLAVSSTKMQWKSMDLMC